MRSLLLFFFFLLPFFSDAQTAGFPNGPRMKFDFTEIVDTIRLSDLDSTCSCVRSTRYVFPFVNAGNAPLIVRFTPGSDPDYNCYYPQDPVRPGKRDSIVICAPGDRFRMDKSYTINSNSVVGVTIRVKRVQAFAQVPPEWRAAREKQALKKLLRAELGYLRNSSDSLEEKKDIRITVHPDSLPGEFRETLSLPGPMRFDSATQYLFIERSGGSQSTYVRSKSESRYRAGTMALTSDGKTKRWYDWSYRITRKEKLLRTRTKRNGHIEHTYRVTEYVDGKKTESYRYKESYPLRF